MSEELDRKNMTPFDELQHGIDALYDEAKLWADGTPIENSEQHDAVTIIHDELHALGKKADELRVEEVAPLDTQRKAITAKFHPLIGDTKSGKGKVVLGKATLKSVLAVWRTKQAKIKEEEASRAREEAAAIAEKAQEAIRASAGNLEAREEAETLLSDAKDAEKLAVRFTNNASKNNGLRTSYKAELLDITPAIEYYWKHNPQAFIDLVTGLAQTDVASGLRIIPGFTVHEIKKAS